MSESGPNDDRGRTEVSAAETEVLARLIGLEIPEQDRELLAEALAEQRSSVAEFDCIAADAGLAGDDLTIAMPALVWDPRWR